MAATKVVLQLLVVFALCVSHLGLALPIIDSATPPKSQDVLGKQQGAMPTMPIRGDLLPPANRSPLVAVGGDQQAKPASLPISKAHINNTEKLKRGLSNFMNQLNPAPYFVPQEAAKSSQAAIKDGGSEAVIKGPKRLTRPMGSPLRWGR